MPEFYLKSCGQDSLLNLSFYLISSTVYSLLLLKLALYFCEKVISKIGKYIENQNQNSKPVLNRRKE